MASPARTLAVLVSSFGLTALVASSCGEQDYPTTAFRCDPSATDSCPGTHLCCSTDPAALDLANSLGDALPDYAGGSGTPLFSGVDNARSRHGRCIDPAGFGEVEGFDEETGPAVVGCPRPCNPTWGAANVTAVCGADAFCCQTDELGERDCVLDPALGADGCWRSVTGNDIETLGGLDVSDWGPTDHDTHQDPRGDGCRAFVEGVDAANPGDLERACYRKLSAADQRGLCTPAGGETDVALVCPLADPEYIDACERKNLDEERAGCG